MSVEHTGQPGPAGEKPTGHPSPESAQISAASGPSPASGRGKHSLVPVIVTVGIVIIGIILTATYAYHRLLRTPEEVAVDLAKQVSNSIREFFNITPRVTVNQVVIIHESYPSFELATVTRETTATYEYRNQWLGSEKSITMKGRFRIKAGFDLSQSAALDVQPSPLKIVAKFPAPKVLSVELISHDIERSENGYWNRLKPEDQKQALDELLHTGKVEGAAGIATEAKKNLEEKLRSLVEEKKIPIQFEYTLPKK